MTDLSYVRTQEVPHEAPPAATTGLVGWIRENLFSSIPNAILTLFGAYLIYLLVPPILDFAFFSAIYEGVDREACLAEGGGHVGACWPFVEAKLGQYIYGRYPLEERWRIDLTGFLFLILLVPALIPNAPFKNINVILLLGAFPLAAIILLTGGAFVIPVWLWALTVIIFAGVVGLALMPVFAGQGTVSDSKGALLAIAGAFIIVALIYGVLSYDFGLIAVETPLWGGIMLTLVIAVTGIVASLPIGIMLALGRRSDMPVVKMISIIFIEFWRGVPLVTVLFMSSVVLPLFLPEGVTFDKLLRALIGVALFASAYMAEVVRGGLQAIPKGQYEGAMALGLRFWEMMGLIVLPQALKLVIPGIVNTFIGLFKDTTLVLIIGLFDLLGMIQLSFTDAKWSTPVTSHTGYLFAAIFYFIFCFGMSRYSIYMEERLHTGHKR